MRQITKKLTTGAAVGNAVCAAQQPLGAGALTINGANATGGVATFPAAYAVSITSNGNDSTRTFTITGTDAAGNAVSQTITGPNTTTVFSTVAFKTVTSVTISAASVGTAITVGFGSFAVTEPLLLDIHGRPDISLQVVVDTTLGTPTWTIQQTLDNPFTSAPGSVTWFDHPDTNLVSQTVNRQGNYAYVPAAVRLKQNATAGAATITIIQSGDNRA